MTITMNKPHLYTRAQVETLALALYKEAIGDFQWQALIRKRAVDHIRKKGIEVTKINEYYKVAF